MTNLQENVERFAGKITPTLKNQADNMVKDVLTKGASPSFTYSFIDDSKSISDKTAERQINLVNKNLGDNPSEEDKQTAAIQIKNIQDRAAGTQDTPKSNAIDYVVEQLIRIYRLEDGQMTSYGFNVTPQMKENVINGLSELYNMFDPKGVFKSFFIGGGKSTRGSIKPNLPINEKGKVDWEFFNDLYVLTTRKATGPDVIKRLIAAYNPDDEGSFSSLFMVNASFRYRDAYKSVRVHKARKDDPDAILRTQITKSVGDVSADEYRGGSDGTSTLADLIADPSSVEGGEEFDLSGNLQPAFQEVLNWIKNNMKEGDYKAELFKGAFIDGKKPVQMSQEPEKYPLVAQGYQTDKAKAKNNLNRLKGNAKFQKAFKDIISKHVPDIAGKDADMSNLSFNINKKGQDSSFERDADKAGYSTMTGDDFERDYYGSAFDDGGEEPETVSLDDLDPNLYESVLTERVARRVKSLIAESLWNKFMKS